MGAGGDNDNAPSSTDHKKSNIHSTTVGTGEREIYMSDVMNELIAFTLSKPASQPSNLTQVTLPF